MMKNPTEKRFCPKCGTEADPYACYCERCGLKLGDERREKRQETKPAGGVYIPYGAVKKEGSAEKGEGRGAARAH